MFFFLKALENAKRQTTLVFLQTFFGKNRENVDVRCFPLALFIIRFGVKGLCGFAHWRGATLGFVILGGRKFGILESQKENDVQDRSRTFSFFLLP